MQEEWKRPIWTWSLKERADAERKYWKWARQVHENTVCAIDHIFKGPRGGVTDAQLEQEKLRERETNYWQWTNGLKAKHKCSIDQAWTH